MAPQGVGQALIQINRISPSKVSKIDQRRDREKPPSVRNGKRLPQGTQCPDPSALLGCGYANVHAYRRLKKSGSARKRLDVDQYARKQDRRTGRTVFACGRTEGPALLISLDNAILASANLQTINLSYSAGDTVFDRGAPAQFIYVVSIGALCRFRPLPRGRRAILQFLFAGDGFGYEPGNHHRDTVQALTATEVLATGRKGLVAAASKSRCLEALFFAAARAFVIAEEQSLIVRGRTATERTALFLLEMNTRLATANEIVLPMGRKAIANYLGLTVETVSRVMNEFHRAKIIEIRDHTPRRITIRNKARLEKLASDAPNFELWKR
jgi:CRP/FNR family transcriptional regulator, nitrogen fixation regulation protein